MLVPAPGSPGFEEFMRKARNPSSMEAQIVRGMTSKATDDTQEAVRKMLYQMIELVPGQLFRDIGKFHAKFQLLPTEDPGHALPSDILEFRLRFMLEELREYAQAVGFDIGWNTGSGFHFKETGQEFNAEKAFDGLIDLVYVALGTAFLHRFLFNHGWDRVQEANMAKERASGADDERSTRKHSADIVKPSGWQPPVLADLL